MENKITLKEQKEYLDNIIGILKKHDIIHGIDPKKLKMILEDLGPTYIKFGQIMSSRPDILPDEYCQELKQLTNNVKPIEFTEIKKIIEQELHTKINEIFKNINEQPIGSASIAQVHEATLLNDTEVVIKVQRPNIQEKMNLDIILLRKAINILKINKMFKKYFDIDRALEEMWEVAKDELDFLKEENNLEEFYENNKDIVYIDVPKVYKEYTTTKILIMEKINGVSINNKTYLEQNGYDLNEIGNKLAVNYIKQALTDGFFHADPHQDNILIREGKIVYLDFGMMSRLNQRDKTLLKECITAIIKNDIKEIEHILLIFTDNNDEIDHTQLCKEIEFLLEKNKILELKNIDIKEFAKDFFTLISKNNIKLPKDITFLVRGIVVIEGVLENIDENLNLMEVLKNNSKEESIKDMLSEENLNIILTNMINQGTSLISLPNEILTFIKSTNRGETKINLELHGARKEIDKVEMLLHEVILCILDAAFILGASLLSKDDNLKLIFYIFTISAIVLTITLFLQMYRDKKD